MADIDTPINKTQEDEQYLTNFIRVFRPGILDNYVRYAGASLGTNDLTRRASLTTATSQDHPIWVTTPRAIFALDRGAWQKPACPDDVANAFRADILQMQRLLVQAQAHLPPPTAAAPAPAPAPAPVLPVTAVNNGPSELDKKLDEWLDTPNGFKTALKEHYKNSNIKSVHDLIGNSQTCDQHIALLKDIATFNAAKTTAFKAFWQRLQQPDQHQKLMDKTLSQQLKTIDHSVHQQIQSLALARKLHIIDINDLREEIINPTAGGITDAWITNVLIKDTSRDPAGFHIDWKTQLLALVKVQREAPIDLHFTDACRDCLTDKQIQKLKQFDITTTKRFTAALGDRAILLELTKGIGSLKNSLNTFQSRLARSGSSSSSSSDSKTDPSGPSKESLYLYEANGPPQLYTPENIGAFCDSLSQGSYHISWFFNYFLLHNNIMWALQIIHLHAAPAQTILEQTIDEAEWFAKTYPPPPNYKKTTDRNNIWTMYIEWVNKVVPPGEDNGDSKRSVLAHKTNARDIINAAKDAEEALNQMHPHMLLGTCLNNIMQKVRKTCASLTIYEESPLAMQVISQMANHLGLLLKKNRAKSNTTKCNRLGIPTPLTERFPQDVDPSTGVPNSNIIGLAKLEKIVEHLKNSKIKETVSNQFAAEMAKTDNRKRNDHPTDDTQQSPSEAHNDRNRRYEERRNLDQKEKNAFEKEMGYSIYKFETNGKTCKWCLWNCGYMCHKHPKFKFTCNNKHTTSITRAQTKELKQCTSFQKLAALGHA